MFGLYVDVSAMEADQPFELSWTLAAPIWRRLREARVEPLAELR
jgi:hypothetical protein